MAKDKQAKKQDVVDTEEDKHLSESAQDVADDAKVQAADPQADRAGAGSEGTEAEGDTAVEKLDQHAAKVLQLEEERLRAMADLENYKKRMVRQFEDVIRSANDKLLGELLEIVDNLERALQNSGVDAATGGTDATTFRKGIELIYGQVTEFLSRYDVRPIESLGKPFDPVFHEALMQVDSDEYDEGVVAVEISKGYMLGKRVLRHTKVAVSKGEPEEKDETKASEGGQESD